MYKILLVDDDKDIQKTNEIYLKKRGYEVFCAGTAREMLGAALTVRPDCIVLDVGLPEEDGVSACEQLREISNVPVIFLSVYGQEYDRIKGLKAGGDDYLAKPYSLEELELRIRLRIRDGDRDGRYEILQFGALTIDMGLREVRYGKRRAELSALEFDLLAFLAKHPGQVFSYEQIYDRVWKTSINKGVHNLQMCVARVRQKLDGLCPDVSYIETVHRKGYRFRGGL